MGRSREFLDALSHRRSFRRKVYSWCVYVYLIDFAWFLGRGYLVVCMADSRRYDGFASSRYFWWGCCYDPRFRVQVSDRG